LITLLGKIVVTQEFLYELCAFVTLIKKVETEYIITHDFLVTYEFRVLGISISIGRGGSDICSSPTLKGSAYHRMHILV
jgi:hypothetical protein